MAKIEAFEADVLPNYLRTTELPAGMRKVLIPDPVPGPGVPVTREIANLEVRAVAFAMETPP